jgi:23S rRNA (guanosine2251-2'-O)-methyltransferase
MTEILYGRQPVLETLRAGRRRTQRVLLREGVKPSAELDAIRRAAAARGVPVEPAPVRRLRELTGASNSQGAAAEVSDYPLVPLADTLRTEPDREGDALVLVLDHVQDPQNLGAILRVADAAGVTGVVLPARRAAHVTPAAVRASAGAAEHVRVCMTQNLVRAMKTLKQEEGFWIAGLDSRPGAKPITETDLRGPLALVLGSEGRGLGRLVGETCDFLVRLPMRGRVASLNVAAAGAAALYEVLRQRGVS